MLWHLQHGGTAEENRAALEKRGAPIPAYLTAPDILPGYETWFAAFWELATERRMPGGPIPASAIDAWPVSDWDRDAFHRCIRSMDRAYLAHYAPKKGKEVSDTPLSPALFASKFGDRKR